MKKGVVVFGDLPTEPEVKKLLEAFPLDTPTLWPYAEIEAVLDLCRGTARFHSVTDAWREYVLTYKQRVINAVLNTGFRLLSPGETVEHGSKCVRKIERAARRGIKQLSTVREADLDAHQRRIYQTNQTAMVATTNETARARKDHQLFARAQKLLSRANPA